MGIHIRYFGPVQDTDEQYCEYDDGTCEGDFWDPEYTLAGKTFKGGTVCVGHRPELQAEVDAQAKRMESK